MKPFNKRILFKEVEKEETEQGKFLLPDNMKKAMLLVPATNSGCPLGKGPALRSYRILSQKRMVSIPLVTSTKVGDQSALFIGLMTAMP